MVVSFSGFVFNGFVNAVIFWCTYIVIVCSSILWDMLHDNVIVIAKSVPWYDNIILVYYMQYAN